MERHCDLTIIGAGPVGMSAVIYGSRAGLKTAMLETGASGRKLIKTVETSNWPGIIGTNGAKLVSDMFEHSTSFGAECLYGNVIHMENGAYGKIVYEDETGYEVKAVIVAIRTQGRIMNVPGELENTGCGASYCAVCDGTFSRDREIVVVGGGNSALEEANYLIRFASKMNIIIRRGIFRTDSIVQNVIKDNPKITVVTKHVSVRVVGDGMRVTGLVIRNVDTNMEAEMKTHGIFLHIGSDPATSSLEGLDILDERGYMTVDENYETKAKGIYGAGDVTAKKLRQVVTATNDGAITTQHAFHGIKEI